MRWAYRRLEAVGVEVSTECHKLRRLSRERNTGQAILTWDQDERDAAKHCRQAMVVLHNAVLCVDPTQRCECGFWWHERTQDL